MTPAEQLADRVSRTDLLMARRGLFRSLDESRSWFADRPVLVRIDKHLILTQTGQGALLAAATLLHRAGYPVHVDAPTDTEILAGPYRGRPLLQTLDSLGATTVELPDGLSRDLLRVIDIGQHPRSHLTTVVITWDRWVAGTHASGQRLPERDGCSLAPILAAALAVSEIFASHIGVADACWRDVTMSLWNPTSANPASDTGPAVSELPAKWLLVGLGHLGQANAWCLAQLPYAWGSGEVWVADDDAATSSNLSTGVLTERTHLVDPSWGIAVPKTRFVARSLEAAGLRTRLLESRISRHFQFEPTTPPIALIGVDNLDFRREISDHGWPIAIDAGLGSHHSSFNSIGLHTFDGTTRSSGVAAWQSPPHQESDTTATAFHALRAAGVDECGIVTLAGKNVAAAFVGMVAACFTVAEAIRRTTGGPVGSRLSIDLSSGNLRGDVALQGELWRYEQVPSITTTSGRTSSTNLPNG